MQSEQSKGEDSGTGLKEIVAIAILVFNVIIILLVIATTPPSPPAVNVTSDS